MIPRLTLSLFAISTIFLYKTMSWAGPPSWYPASPLQPAGRAKTSGEDPKPTSTMIPAAPPAEAPAPEPSRTPVPTRPKPLSCEDVCSQDGLKITFTLEGGRIGPDSRLDLEQGGSLEIRAYSDSCPHAEGKEMTLTAGGIPQGCVFVFIIPSSRAVLSGNRSAPELRCAGGKLGMSSFHCNESTSPASSFAGDALSREP